MLDPVELLIEQNRTLGRIEARLDHGQETHKWLIATTRQHGEVLIRHGEALKAMRRELRSKNESGSITISVWELLAFIKEAWPWLTLLGAAIAKAVLLALPWLHSIGAR